MTSGIMKRRISEDFGNDGHRSFGNGEDGDGDDVEYLGSRSESSWSVDGRGRGSESARVLDVGSVGSEGVGAVQGLDVGAVGTLNRVGRLNVKANFGNSGSERAGAGFANFNLGSGVSRTEGLGCEAAARSSGRERTGPTVGIFNASVGASGRERASAGVTKFKTTSVASLRDRIRDAVVQSNAMSGAFGRERAGAGMI
jgi:hypothetical protein